MRSIIVLAMFAASLTHAAWNGYTEDRTLELGTDGVSRLEIEAGAGALVVTGASDSDRILVTATINVPDQDDEDALEIIEKRLKLSLEEKDGEARLEAYFENSGWSWGDSPSVDVEVSVPHGLELVVDDSSGSLEVTDSQSSVEIDDGSGSIRVAGATSVVIDDGSGSITVTDVAGNVEIEDAAVWHPDVQLFEIRDAAVRLKAQGGIRGTRRGLVRSIDLLDQVKDPNRIIQDPYSIRCQPQVTGAAVDLIRQAWAQRQDRAWDRAEALLEDAVRRFPGDDRPYINLASLLEQPAARAELGERGRRRRQTICGRLAAFTEHR